MDLYDNEPTMMSQGPPLATLVIRQGTQAGMSFPILGNQIIIGREESIDVTLQDPEASRRHARISWQMGQFVVEDLGSTNGTFINGVQITRPQTLNPGDSLGIGQTALIFQVEGTQMGAPQYQSPPQQAASTATPAPAAATEAGDSRNKLTQYALYGCGCLILLVICVLVIGAGYALFFPEVVENLIP